MAGRQQMQNEERMLSREIQTFLSNKHIKVQREWTNACIQWLEDEHKVLVPVHINSIIYLDSFQTHYLLICYHSQDCLLFLMFVYACSMIVNLNVLFFFNILGCTAFVRQLSNVGL